MPERDEEQHIPLGQIVLDDMFLLMLLGLIVPFLIYTVWGLMDIGTIPPLPDEPISGPAAAPAVADGARLAQSRGCVACHSADGAPGVGPSWKGLFGAQRPLADGATAVADDAYLRESIRQPGAKVVAGFANLMPPYTDLTDDELGALVDYIKGLN